MSIAQDYKKLEKNLNSPSTEETLSDRRIQSGNQKKMFNPTRTSS
jgi:hypothetical protein